MIEVFFHGFSNPTGNRDSMSPLWWGSLWLFLPIWWLVMHETICRECIRSLCQLLPFHFTEKFSTWKIRLFRHKINFTNRQKRKIERRQVMDLKIKEGHLQSYLLSVIRLHMHKRFSTVVENHSKNLIFTTLRERSEQLFYLNFGAKNQRWKSSQF